MNEMHLSTYVNQRALVHVVSLPWRVWDSRFLHRREHQAARLQSGGVVSQCSVSVRVPCQHISGVSARLGSEAQQLVLGEIESRMVVMPPHRKRDTINCWLECVLGSTLGTYILYYLLQLKWW